MTSLILACLFCPGSFEEPPAFLREFRAAWIATVDNIDWPSHRGMPSDLQRAELVRILDTARTMRLNAVILQVRPAADALYPSKLEPWSEYLTGKQGSPPKPMYDPLAFAVSEAHKRGLELHCWFNPYRAKHPSAHGQLAASHIAKTHSSLVKSYGDLLWMDPGEPFVQRRSLKVIADVVRRYDVDGVHIDDYFYPYPEKSIPFPDHASYARFGGGLSLENWRRKNIDGFVASMYREVKSIKPWVKVGISPFGIFRPGIPSGIRSGVDQYAELYADCLKWYQSGWCDYLAPQLYWPIAQKAQSFTTLLEWWDSVNVKRRHLWPGLYTSRTMTWPKKGSYDPQEVVDQIFAARRQPGATGHIHFSMKALSQNSAGVADRLRGACYQQDAVIPASPWLGDEKLPAPVVSEREGTFSWEPARPAFLYAVSQRYGATWLQRVVPGSQKTLAPDPSLPAGALDEVCVSAVDRYGNLSLAGRWQR